MPRGGVGWLPLLGVLGFLHLTAMGMLAADRSRLTVTPPAWLCGLALLTVAVAAPITASGAARLRRLAPAT